MNYSRRRPRSSLLALSVLAAIVFASCGGESRPPPPPAPPPFVPQSIKITLGDRGGEITLMTTQAGGYTRDGEPFQSGTTVEAEGNNYKLTLADGRWSAEYVPPDPVAVALGKSGQALLITRNEDGSYQAGDITFKSGDALPPVSNGSVYRLTLDDETWQVEYVVPDPIAVELGMSGETLALTRQENGSFTSPDGDVIDSGDIWTLAATGSDYKLTFVDGEWSAEYAPPVPSTIILGLTGESLQVTRLEDGSYQANGEALASGDTVPASNGNMYRLYLVNDQWREEYVVPASIHVRLGISGEVLALTAQENGTFRTDDGVTVGSGDTWTAEANGSEYRLTLLNGEWSAEYLPPHTAVVVLGAAGDRVSVERREDGRYEVNGRLLESDQPVIADNGNAYRLTFANGRWTAEFVPDSISVDLGPSGETITLVREEGGQYWLGRMVIQTGHIHQTESGASYRLVLTGGKWTAQYVPEPIQVQAGDSGAFIVLLHLEDGTFLLDGEEVRSGETVVRDGNEYVLTRTGNRWSADFRTGTVEVDLPGGGSVTLAKQEDGTYTLDGRVVRSGSTRTINGVRHRLTLGDDGWTATRRVFPTTPTGGTGGDTGTGGTSTSSRTESDERHEVVFGQTDFRLCDDCSSETGSGNEGTFLEVGPTGAKAEYSLYDLLGRSGVVSITRTYADSARERIQEIADTIKRYRVLYELEAIDPNVHINTGDGDVGLWTQAVNELKKIFGSSYTRATPWRGNSVEFREVDDVIEDLESLADTLSSRSAFKEEFESFFAVGQDVDDYFETPSSRINFGSTRNTRFGAYANKETTGDAVTANWMSGVFAYSQLERPGTTGLPTRGEATYRGDALAVDAMHQLYSGEIELSAAFSNSRIDGRVRDLKDEDGDRWTHASKEVESIGLPRVTFTDGEFETSTSETTIRYTDNSQDVSVEDSVFQGEFVNEGSEVLGTWSVGNANLLEGSFGASRASTAAAARPTVNDRGAESKVFLANTIVSADSGRITFTSGTITIDPDVATESPINFVATQLRGSRRDTKPDIPVTFVKAAMTVIDNQITALNLVIADSTTGTNERNAIFTLVDTELDKVFGSHTSSFESYPVDGSNDPDDTAARNLLSAASRALSTVGNLRNALDPNDTTEVFSGDASVDQAENIYNAVPFKLAIEFDYSDHDYTRFGAWAETSRAHAAVASPQINTGVFAYSSLIPVNYSDSLGLDFTAVYEGGTIAVDSRGSIYMGSFELTVEWNPDATNDVSSLISDLKKVADDSWFQHDDKDVEHVGFSGMTVPSTGPITFDSSSPTVWVQYRNDGAQSSLSGSSGISGTFVQESVDGPLGVIGQWSLSDSDLDAPIKGAFGAELVP